MNILIFSVLIFVQFSNKHDILGHMYKLGENVASSKNRNPTNVRNQCRGEPYVRPLTETEIKPMTDGEGKP